MRHVASRDAIAQLVGAFAAQNLLDGAAHQLGLHAQTLLLLRPLRQQPEAVADEIGGGLVARVEDEDAVVQQLVFGQAFAVGLALYQARQHIVLGIAGMGPAIGNELFQVGEKFGHRPIAALEPSETPSR